MLAESGFYGMAPEKLGTSDFEDEERVFVIGW